jgi:hypothetical protein
MIATPPQRMTLRCAVTKARIGAFLLRTERA